jgi:hypothetical protein
MIARDGGEGGWQPKMSNQTLNTLVIAGVALLIAFAWILSVLLVRWDVQRRRLAGAQRYAWPILAALLPLFGAIAYLFARYAAPGVPEQRPVKRVTAPQRPLEPERRLPTIAVSNLMRGTIDEVQPSIPPAGNGKQSQGVPVLVALDGPYKGKEFALEQLPVRLGRGSGATIRLDEDLGVSRLHAEIYEQEGWLRIRDMNSSHGTHLNGQSIADAGLQPGDQIQVGYTLLLIRVVEERR